MFTKGRGGFGGEEVARVQLSIVRQMVLVDRGIIWYRVLVARYGEVAGRLEVGGRSGSTWWRELAKIREGVEGVNGRTRWSVRWGRGQMYRSGRIDGYERFLCVSVLVGCLIYLYIGQARWLRCSL